jgi:hypothetical protein
MDKKFLEFWGNFLLAAARGQQRMDDLNRWIKQGFSGVQQLNDMFKASYGLQDDGSKARGFDEAWQSATAAFNASLKEHLQKLGWVPRADVDRLNRKNADLKQKIDDLEKTVQRLQNLLDQERPGQARSVLALEELAQKQTEDFNKLMQSLQDALQKTAKDKPSGNN